MSPLRHKNIRAKLPEQREQTKLAWGFRVVKVVDEVNSQTPFKNLPSMLKLTPFQRRYPAGQDQTPHCSTSP